MEWTHLRKYPRIVVDLPAIYTLDARTAHTRILTLGGGGLFLGITNPLTAGTQVNVRFRPVKHLEPLQVMTVVRYQIPGKGTGVEFLEIDPEYRQKLMKFILHRIGVTRQFTRAPLVTQVEHEGGRLIGFSRDISVGGMFIETNEPVAVGTYLKLRFNLDDNGPIILVGAVVRYAAGKVGMGARFLDLSTADQKRVDVYVTKGLASDGQRLETKTVSP